MADARLEELQTLFKSARLNPIGDGKPSNAQIAMRKQAGTAGGSLSLVTARPRDPLWYWRQNNVPYDIWNDPQGTEIQRVRDLCRLLYVTHPLLGSCIDVYTKYPLSGMEITCPKDKSLAKFYSELFMDDLEYEEFLPDVGREYWLVGEGFPLASFDDISGVWESDELMLPEDVEVIKTPFQRGPRFLMALPWHIRNILNNRWPRLEYQQLVENYPEFMALNFSDIGQYGHRDERFLMPISDKLLAQVKRKGDSFHHRGIPIMMRAFRAVAQEEMLNAAQDSISQRLYTPLILARIGASATDLGTDAPWVPTQPDLDAFVEDVNAALAADFRLIVTHFAVNMQNVFGRESMPTLTNEFVRLEDRMLQAFGMSRTMLAGASSGETYAADALNRDMMSQLMSEYQRAIKRLVRRRAEVVAEAQGHYDFVRKGGRSVPIMETVKETDAETGEIRIVERPKLLLPELRIKAMNMRDEKQFTDFLGMLRAEGVPISQRTRLINVDIDLDEEAEAVIEEQVQQAVQAQQVRKRLYQHLKREGLPIPEDLREDFEPRALGSGEPTDPAAQAPMDGEAEGDQMIAPDTLGTVAPDTIALVPVEDVEAPTRDNRVLNQSTRPPESDEQRADMPKASSIAAWALSGENEWADMFKDQYLTQYVTDIVAIANGSGEANVDGDGEASEIEVDPESGEPRQIELPVLGSYRLRHVGHRHQAYFYRSDEEPLPDPI